MPKFVVFVSASADSEDGKMPKTEEFTAMNAFNKEYESAIIYADGLLNSSKGFRVHYSEGTAPSVTPGPFALDNLVAGFWVLQLDSMEKAIEFAKKAPFKEGHVEVRQIASADDFGAELPEDIKEAMRNNE